MSFSNTDSDLSYIASLSKDWIDSALDKEFRGAKFYWNKDRAREFADVDIETLLLDEYYLNGKKWMYPGIVDTILDLWEERKKRSIRVVCIAAGIGCLPYYAPINTPSGYVPIENLSIGDKVFGVNGSIAEECTVINKIYSGKKEVFRIYTKDGNHIDATKEHIFRIKRHYYNRGKYRTEEEEWSVEKIINYINSNKTNSKTVGLLQPKYISYTNDPTLKISPYVLGVMLGDGIIGKESVLLCSDLKDVALRDRFEKEISKYECELSTSKQKYVYGIVGKGNKRGKRNGLLRLFKEYGISSQNKFIPSDYITSSVEDRLQLLAGLLDTDGSLIGNGSYEFTQKRKNIMDSVKELVESLGGKITISNKVINGTVYYRAYLAINFEVPCVLDRKRRKKLPQGEHRRRKISRYESLGFMDTYDITVDNKSHCFLSYNNFITHNSGKTAGLGAALNWLNWYEFACKFDPNSDIACPQEYYGHKSTSWTAFIALSKTLDKSKKITFSEMKPAFESNFNRDYFPINPKKQSILEIPGNYTMVFPNTATEAANAGYNVYSFVMDEISFLEMIDTSSRSKGRSSDTYDQAKEAFESAYFRMTSRFGNDGMGILISSVNYDEDFLMSKIRDAYNGKVSESEVYYKILLPWKVNPKKFSFDKYFYFDTEKFSIVEDDMAIKALDKYYVETPIEQMIFGSSLDDPNDKLLEKVRSGRLVV